MVVSSNASHKGDGAVKGTTLIQLAIDPDSPAMGSHNTFGDIQSEPKTSMVMLADLPKTLEHGLQFVHRNSGPVSLTVMRILSGVRSPRTFTTPPSAVNLIALEMRLART